MVNIDKIDRNRANSLYKLSDYQAIVWYPSWLKDIMTINKQK